MDHPIDSDVRALITCAPLEWDACCRAIDDVIKLVPGDEERLGKLLGVQVTVIQGLVRACQAAAAARAWLAERGLASDDAQLRLLAERFRDAIPGTPDWRLSFGAYFLMAKTRAQR